MPESTNQNAFASDLLRAGMLCTPAFLVMTPTARSLFDAAARLMCQYGDEFLCRMQVM